LPIQISALKELSLRYAVSSESTGKISLSAAVWLTSSGQASAPNPLAITNEIAIWLDYPEGATPTGERSGSPRRRTFTMPRSSWTVGFAQPLTAVPTSRTGFV